MDPILLTAVDLFLSEHTGFESTEVHDLVQADIKEVGDLQEASLVPVRHKILNFDGALQWGFFLTVASDRFGLPFSFDKYARVIRDIYDLATDAIIASALERAFGEAEDGEDGGE